MPGLQAHTEVTAPNPPLLFTLGNRSSDSADPAKKWYYVNRIIGGSLCNRWGKSYVCLQNQPAVYTCEQVCLITCICSAQFVTDLRNFEIALRKLVNTAQLPTHGASVRE